MAGSSRVGVFGPHPILTITVETRPDALSDDIHVHAGGQGVWVARMAGGLGGHVVLCGSIGGEVGRALQPLLDRLPFDTRLVATNGVSGAYVTDHRMGDRKPVAVAWSPPMTRHELDDLYSVAVATARECDVLVVANPLPGDALPSGMYADLVAEARSAGTAVLVDLSSPRLDEALTSEPDLVKLNDWELAEYVEGPVETQGQRAAAVRRLRTAGAASVIVTRGGEPAYAVRADGRSYEIAPPRFQRGSPEGCGDSMMGGIATAWASGADWLSALRLGTAAGAANYLRHGLGTGLRSIVEQMVSEVRVSPL